MEIMRLKRTRGKNTNLKRLIETNRGLKGILPLMIFFCITASCSLPLIKPIPEALIEIPPYISADEAVEALTTSHEKIENLKGFVKIKTSDFEGKTTSSISGYLAFKNPDKVRFSYIGPFGITLFEVVIDGDEIVLYSPQEMTAYVGTTGDKEIEDFRGSENIFSPQSLKTLFSKPQGDRFLIENLDQDSILYGIIETESGWEIIEKTIIARVEMRPRAKERFFRGIAISQMTYLEYVDIDGISVPTTITIDDFAGGDSIKIAMSNINLNGTMPDDAFDTKVEEPWNVKGLEEFVPLNF